MSDWKVTGKYETGTSGIANLLTGGAIGKWYKYELQHVETGEEKTVIADDSHNLGAKIADGDWDEEE